MRDLSFLALEIKEVGESVLSNSQDLFLILNLKVSDKEEVVAKITHGLNLVENILSILTYLSTLDLEMLGEHEDLINEVNKIKFSCYGLQTALSKTLESGKPSIYLNRKNIGKLLTTVKNSGNKIITISYILEQRFQKRNDEVSSEESENVCYKDKETCEQYCPNGFCIEDNAKIFRQADSNCPENIETFTRSSLTHVENGYEENEHMPWHVTSPGEPAASTGENKVRSIWDILQIKLSSLKHLSQTIASGTVYTYTEENNETSHLNSTGDLPTGIYPILESTSVHYPPLEINEIMINETEQSISSSENVHNNNYEGASSKYELENSTILSVEEEVDYTHTTIEEEVADPTTTSSCSDSITTESFDTTLYSYETTTYSYLDSTTEPPTTPSYETTTQDLYKLSQDIYQAAQDLSSKSSEISSISSEISSKSSDISSLVSELNNYEDDELSKKIQAVSKLTQEINSKTSEISSLTSTMSSHASDISSASSDMTTADRHHAFRTTPWQKMTSKSDDLIISAQGVVTAAQDILTKVTELVSASSDLKVATTVANMAGQITAKAQRLISETLNIISRVIELMNVID